MNLSVQNVSYEVGDYIEFKHLITEEDVITYKGKIVSILNNNISIKTEEGDITVTKNDIIKHYPHSSIPYLSIRVLLKELWKNFIFREVKTIKTKDPFMISYQYVNNSGFIRTDRYRNSYEAEKKVPYEYHKNLQVHYKDYFGFTTDRTIRNNDIYYGQEVFFSKKCYSELNFEGDPITGEFSFRRGFKTVCPRAKQYLCGLVENGEKGLFYRKWFICSKEFLTLWTIICEPDHYSLKNKTDGKYVPKSLNEILTELDGSHYNSTNSDMNIKEMQKNYKVNNIESAIIYSPDLYQKVMLSIFNPGALSDELYNYPEKIKSDLMWMR